MADLAERIAALAASGGGDQSAQSTDEMGPGDGYLDEDVEIVGDDDGASEGDTDDDVGGEGDDAAGDTSDEEVTPERRERAEAPSVSRLVRNIGVKERELATARQELRQLQAKVQELSAERGPGRGDSDDPIDLLESMAMRSLNVRDPNDPRVVQFIQDVARDLTLHGFRNDKDPEWTASREALQQRRQERNRFKSYDERVARLERERAEAEVRATRATLHAQTAEYLTTNAKATPLLRAAGEAEGFDPAQVVLDRALAGVRNGEFPDPRDQRELRQLLGAIADSFETHYRTLAGKLVPGATKQTKPLNGRGIPAKREVRQRERTEVRAPRSETTNTRGGGGRGRAAPPQDTDGGERLDLAARIARAERQTRRRA